MISFVKNSRKIVIKNFHRCIFDFSSNKIQNFYLYDEKNEENRGNRRKNCDENLKYAKKFRKIEKNVNAELNDRIFSICEKNFEKICQELKNFSPSLEPMILLNFPQICCKNRQNSAKFTEELLKNWWNLLENRLDEFSPSVISDLNFSFLKLNFFTDGEFLRNFGWENYKKLAEISLRDVDLMSTKKLETFLRLLKGFQSNKMDNLNFTLINQWLNENLIIAVEKWILMQNSGENLGNLLKILTDLKIRRPSDECLKIITDLCAMDNKINVENLLYFAEAFLSWNYNPKDYKKEFWNNWFSAVYSERQQLIERNAPELHANLCYIYLIIATRFDCAQQFGMVQQHWIETVKAFSCYLPLYKIERMAAEIEDNPKINKLEGLAEVLPLLRNRIQLANSTQLVVQHYYNRSKFIDWTRRNDLFSTLNVLNESSNRMLLQSIGWPKLMRIVNRGLADVQYLNSGQYYHILKLIEAKVSTSIEGVPLTWLNKTLANSFQHWMYVNGQKDGFVNYSHLGGILKVLSSFGIKPGYQHSNTLAKICSNAMDLKDVQLVLRGQFYSLLNMSEAFVRWNFDPQLYSGHNFWSKWYAILMATTCATQPYEQAKLYSDYMLVALKFNLDSEFNKVGSQWMDFMANNSSHVSPQSSFLILNEVDKKKLSNGQNSKAVDKFIPPDISKLLHKRLTPLIVEGWIMLTFYITVLIQFLFAVYVQHRLNQVANTKK